jgi:hypothetical protein
MFHTHSSWLAIHAALRPDAWQRYDFNQRYRFETQRRVRPQRNIELRGDQLTITITPPTWKPEI